MTKIILPYITTNMDVDERLEIISIKVQNFKQMIKVLRQEIADLLSEKNFLMNPPQSPIGFKYGNQTK